MTTASTTATTARSWLAIWPNTAIASTGRCLHGGAGGLATPELLDGAASHVSTVDGTSTFILIAVDRQSAYRDNIGSVVVNIKAMPYRGSDGQRRGGGT